MKTALVFGAAPVDRHLRPVHLPGVPVYCADGGYETARRYGFTPVWAGGDFDSLGSIPAAGEQFPCEKDETDTMLAARAAVRDGAERILFYGCLGGRMGHTMANIQMLRTLADMQVCGILMDGRHILTLQRGGSRRYPRLHGYRYFSLFSLSEDCCGVTLRGVAYPMEAGTLSGRFPLGVSNEITGDAAQITVGSGDLLIIYERE